MAGLSYSIRAWIKRNKEYLRRNGHRFRLAADLTENSSRALFEAYKKRIKVLKSEDVIDYKSSLFERATHFGYKGSLSAPSSVMLDFLKKKKVSTIFFEEEEEELASVINKRKQEREAELQAIKRRQVVKKGIARETKKFIDFVPPTYKEVFDDRLVFAIHKTDIDLAIDSGDIELYYNEEEWIRHAKSGIKCIEENVDFIAEKTLSKINETINRLSPAQIRAGYASYAIIAFKGYKVDTENEVVMPTKSILGTSYEPITLQTIRNAIMASSPMEMAIGGVDNYALYLYTIKVVISKHDEIGGCASREHIQTIQSIKKEGITIKRVSPKSTGDNCLIACFNSFYGIKGNVLKADNVRQELGIPKGQIDVKYIPLLSNYYNNYSKTKNGFILVDPSLHLITTSNELDQSLPLFSIIAQDNFDITKQLVIQLECNHYFIIRVEVEEGSKKCKDCGKVYKNKHTCNINVESYYQTKILKKTDMVRVKKLRKQDKVNSDDMVFWDLETFQPDNVHVAYASAYTVNNQYFEHYGLHSMDRTIDEFLQFENRTISAYNGSGFDFYFLMNKLLARGATVSKMILSGGKLMKFAFTYEERTNYVFDLYLFLNCSLAKACESFNTNIQKGIFDHKLMQTWADTETYKPQVIPYLKSDVLGLKEVFEKFNSVIYNEYKINVTNYVTISHMSYEIWSSRLKHKIEVPADIEKYRYIRKTIYGGRTYPLQAEFVSENLTELLSGEMSHQELQEKGDYIFNADATSLYPASMAGTDLMPVAYPTGLSRWSEKGEYEFENGKMGFYDITFSPPKDIRHPILPRKKANGGVEWSLLDGTGVYNSVDIQNAIDIDYKITFNGKCLVYDTEGDVFSAYINDIFKKKEKADREKNEVQKAIWKLFLNALYGKTLQRAIFGTSSIINNITEFYTFGRTYNITDFQILDNDKVLLTGEANEDFEEAKITKPSQLGSFVTAYSRRLMLHFMKAVDPTLKSQIYTYTDTDSLHLKSEAHKILVSKGLILPKSDSRLGYLCSDIKNEGLIYYERNMGPKSYRYEYIDNKDMMVDSTMKTKGIPSRLLKKDFFDADNKPVVEMDGLRKINKRISKADESNAISHFSIANHTMRRTFHATTWTGMDFNSKTGEYYPKGYEGRDEAKKNA